MTAVSGAFLIVYSKAPVTLLLHDPIISNCDGLADDAFQLMKFLLQSYSE